ncbi:MAG: hypothetical protein ABIO57_04135 [Candidatus Paceibacterota bacterium]
MIPTKHIQQTINDSYDFIARQQQTNGSFLSNTGKPTTFYTSLILSTATSNDHSIWSSIQKKAAACILQQLSPQYTVNYWQRNSAEYSTIPYPDDIDDTFVAMQALYKSAPEFVTEEVVARLIELLIQQETLPGGPYKTWITDLKNPVWQESDVVVNSNVATFLHMLNITLPTLETYFDHTIHIGTKSTYYHDEITRLYFITKTYNGIYKKDVIEKILAMQNSAGHWNSPLHTAFVITILLSNDVPFESLERAIDYILRSHTKGQWPATDIYIESIVNNTTTYSSCDAYVSMCCIEALTVFSQKSIAHLSSPQPDIEEKIFIGTMATTCLTITDNEALKIQLQKALGALTTKDPSNEIQLLSYWFAEKLISQGNISKELIQHLAVINTLGWIGYSIYDHIIDGEDYVSQLPLANICILAMVDTLHIICNTEEYAIVKRILDGINEATQWEYAHCRIEHGSVPTTIPDYADKKILAQKSLGHAIGPILLCHKLGHKEEAILIEDFFIQYLIAKQLNDDAHDWHHDIEQGFVNSISAPMIQALQTLDISMLQEHFWEIHIDNVVHTILEHIRVAREILKKITVISDVTFLDSLLILLEQSADRALVERDKTQHFLREFYKD